MPQSKIDSDLRARVDAFVADLSELIREAALDAVHEALGSMPAARPARRGPGRPPAKRKGRKKAAKRKAAKRGKRVRRSSAELDRLKSSFLSYVRSNPGERLEQIGVGMGIDTKELKRPVQLLLEEGKLRTEGQRRGTKYFPGKGGATRKKARKAGKRKTRKKATKRRKKTTRKGAA